MVPPMAPSRVVGGLANSSSSSGIFFQGDGHSQALVNSHLGSSFGNSTNLIPGTGRSSLVPVSGDMSNVVFNSVANSGPSVGASSLVTDANSALSGGPHLQRSASINGDSYMRLPTSPLSFSSNNISISGSSVMDGSSIVQQNSNQDQNTPQVHQSHQQQQQGASSASSFPASQMGQISLPNGQCGLGSFIQEPNHLSQMQKKPRLDVKQEDILQQQVMQQLLQRQDSMQLHSPNAQLQALIQQQRLRQQHQQILQSMPPIQRAHLHQQQQQQLQLRQQLQQQGMQSASASRRPFDAGVCTRRLMQYLYHQRQRPADNAIAYWRKFVAEYFSPRAKKRWCLSMYDNVGHHALGVFPQAAMDAWQCDICNSKSGRGFEATFEVLPRLNEIKFSSGVIDELLFLDLPREFRFPSGIMILEYAKAVQENVYEQLRVIREGQLRITFTPDLKILYWEFCARRHEELLPRRLVAPQVSNLVQAAQKCQSTIAESGSDGVSQQDLKTNSNMVLAAGHQLAKSLELQSLNDLGFSKRYVRCLQISEVVNSMKDLIGFCKDHNAGPIECLKNYPRHAGAATPVQKLMALHPGLSTHMVNNPHMISGRGGALNSSAQAAMALTNYQSLLMRQNSMNSNPNSLQPEAALSPFSHSHQSPSSSHQSMPNLTGYSSPHPQTPQQQQQQPPPQQRSSSANSSQAMQQQQMIQQLLQGMTNNGGSCVQQQSLSGQTINGGIASRNGVAASPNMPGNGVSGGPAPSRSNSFKGPSNSDSSAAGGSTTNGFNHKIQDLPQNLQLSDELVQDIANEFTDNGFFNGDLEDTMGYGWKG